MQYNTISAELCVERIFSLEVFEQKFRTRNMHDHAWQACKLHDHVRNCMGRQNVRHGNLLHWAGENREEKKWDNYA